MSYHNPELYIQIRDGQPYEHPIMADNFKEAFPDVDVTQLPNDRFARFVRLPKPPAPQGKIYGSTTYAWDGNVVTDVHHFRVMTGEELDAQQAETLANVARFKEARIKLITEMLNVGLSEEGRQLWTECLEKHQLWMENEPHIPTNPAPGFPYKDENGIWVAPVS